MKPIETQRLILRPFKDGDEKDLFEYLSGARQEGLFKEFVSFINDENGNPVYENTYQYAILKREWKY